MERTRNFLPLAGFLVCLAAFASYVTFFSRFEATRDVPWVSWILFALGLGLAVAGCLRAFRRPDRYRGKILGPVLGGLSLLLAGFFLLVTLVLTRQLPPSANAPKVGEKIPDFALPDTEGRPVQLSRLLEAPAKEGAAGSWVLLIFYRGYW